MKGKNKKLQIAKLVLKMEDGQVKNNSEVNVTVAVGKEHGSLTQVVNALPPAQKEFRITSQ